MPDRRVAFSPGAERGNAKNDALCCPALLRHDAYLSPIFSFALSHGRSLIATSPHMAQLPRLELLSLPTPSHTLSVSISLFPSTRLTVASFLSFVSSFLPACCFRMLIFFRFLFWRPLPKHSDDPRLSFSLPLFSSSPTTFFLCLHTLLLVYRTNSSAHCRFACSCAVACAVPSARCFCTRPLLRHLLTATSDEFLTPTQRQLLHYVLSPPPPPLPSSLACSASCRHSHLPLVLCILLLCQRSRRRRRLRCRPHTQFGPVLFCCCCCSSSFALAVSVCAALSSFHARSCQCGDRIHMHLSLSMCACVCVNETKAQVKSELSLVGGCTETETDLMIILFLHWN